MTDAKPTEEPVPHKFRYVTLEHLSIDIERSVRDWLAIHGQAKISIDDLSTKHSITALSRKIAQDLYNNIIERRMRDNDRRKRRDGGRRWDDT